MGNKKSVGPRCKLCGHNHWSNEPHVFDDEGGTRSRAKKKESASRKDAPKKVKKQPRKTKKSSAADVERVRKWRKKNKKRYNTYQRELMRKRRQK